MCYAMVDPTRVRTIVLFRELKALPLRNNRMVADEHLTFCVNKSKSGVRGGEFKHLIIVFELVPELLTLKENQLALQRHTLILWLRSSCNLFSCSRQKPPGST